MATIYRTIMQINTSEGIKRTVTKEFSSEEDAFASLRKDVATRVDQLSPHALEKEGVEPEDFVIGKKVESLGSVWGLNIGDGTDTFSMVKVPAAYALLSLNSELFDDYPTDLIGQFETFDEAVKAGKSLVNELIDDQEITVDDFPNTTLAIYLVPIDGFVDYWDGCSWSFEFVDGKLTVKKDK